MKIKRLFTMEGEDPYNSIEFEKRSSTIRNPDGSVVSEWENVTVPKSWSQVATDIIAQKYFRKAGIPKYLKSAKEKGIPGWLQPSLKNNLKEDNTTSNNKEKDQINVKIDFEGIQDRVIAIPVPERRYQGIGFSKNKILYSTWVFFLKTLYILELLQIFHPVCLCSLH